MSDPLTSESRQLQVVHLGEGDDERELVLVHRQLEQRPASDDLENKSKDFDTKYLTYV